MGSNMQKFMVVWDTGSQDLLIETSACDNCQGDVFDVNASSSFSWSSPLESSSTTYMDGTSLTGNFAFDDVCPTSDVDSCAHNFKFVGLTTQNGLSDYEDGIIGLWSGTSTWSSVDQDLIYMNALKSSTLIAEKTFSFYLTGTGGSSYLDFGTPNSAVMNGAPIYIPLLWTDPWWTASLTGLQLTKGDTTLY